MQLDVLRHKTAIGRTELSRPIRLALTDGLLDPNTPLFDYGCGLGDDLRQLESLGYSASGWDPVHRPGTPKRSASIVNLGYVVNVIEDKEERAITLQQAWALSEKLLIVSSRLKGDTRRVAQIEEFSDGVLTGAGTFQKFYDQQELKVWIEKKLNQTPLPAAPGVFYVFRDEEERSTFAASRYRRRIAAPRISKSVELFNEYSEALQPLMDFYAWRGRIPEQDELANADQLHHVFGSIKRAFQIVLRATDEAQWEAIQAERAQDFAIYLGLSRFDRRPKFSLLPRDMRLDVRSFFSTYSKACKEADSLLFSLGDPGNIERACRESSVGKLTPTALYVHESVLEYLSPELRLYEACARRYLGRVEEANVIKLKRQEPKVSYLSYPDFETDPHPSLASSVSVHLQTFRTNYRDYEDRENPPILHRKELFIHESHPLHSKFTRLTQSEEAKGLYQDTARIGLKLGWEEVLDERGVMLKGHRVVRRTSQSSS